MKINNIGVIILTHWCGFLNLKYYIYDNTKLWNENSNNEPSVESFENFALYDKEILFNLIKKLYNFI